MLETYPDVLTVPQMQAALQIGKSKAYELIHSGELTYLTIGRQVRIPKPYLIEYMEKQRCSALPNRLGQQEGGMIQ